MFPAASNPKEEVLTFCQRRKLAAPQVTRETVGEQCRVELSLQLGNRTLKSGAHVAASPKEADELAFAALFRDLVALDDEAEADPGEWVTDEREAALRRDNPKGRLTMALLLRSRPAPDFDSTPIVYAGGNAFEGTAILELPDGTEVCTPLRRARAKVIVEQANAHDLLAQDAVLAAISGVPDMIALNHARALLTELQQAGRMIEFGINYLRHANATRPLFQVVGWWRRADGERHVTEPVEAISKKAAEALASRSILEGLREALARESSTSR